VIFIKQIQKGNDFLPSFSIKELEKRYKSERNIKAKLRLLCAIHRKRNKTIMEIAEITGLPKSTVSDNLRRLKRDNLKLLYDKKNKGALPRLTIQEQRKLINTLSQEPTKAGYPFVFWTTKLVQYYIRKKFKKEFTQHGIRKLLYRLGFTMQKPRQIHHKGNVEDQMKFKKNLDEKLRDIQRTVTRSSSWTKRPLY
jgi:transposase